MGAEPAGLSCGFLGRGEPECKLLFGCEGGELSTALKVGSVVIHHLCFSSLT